MSATSSMLCMSDHISYAVNDDWEYKWWRRIYCSALRICLQLVTITYTGMCVPVRVFLKDALATTGAACKNWWFLGPQLQTGFTLITSIARQCCLTHETSRMCNWYCSHWSMPCRRSPCNGAACLFGWGRQAPRYDGAAAGYTKYSPTVVYLPVVI